MKLIYKILLAPYVLLLACSSNPQEEVVVEVDQKTSITPPEVINDSSTTATYTSETFETTGTTGWGYLIRLNGEEYLSQPTIPAIQEKKGFSNPMFAKITADFTISKIQKGIVPPTPTIEELDSLGVLK